MATSLNGAALRWMICERVRMTLCNVLGYTGIRGWNLASGEWCWVIPGPDWEAANDRCYSESE